MDIKKIIKNTESILEQIKYHNNLYYNLDKPEISDAKYDELISNLKDLKNYRKEILENSHNFKHADYIIFSQRYKTSDHIIVAHKYTDTYSSFW